MQETNQKHRKQQERKEINSEVSAIVQIEHAWKYIMNQGSEQGIRSAPAAQQRALGNEYGTQGNKKVSKSSPLFKVIFTLVRGNDWKAGTYGNMDVDKRDEMDDNRFACAITWGRVKNYGWLLLDMLPNCGILSDFQSKM